MFGVQDILAVVFVAGAFWYVIRFIRRSMSGKGGCHCEQGTPCGDTGKSSSANETSIRRLPLVSLSPVAENKVESLGPSTPSPASTETTPSPVPKPK